MRLLQLLIENVSKRYKRSDFYALRDLTLDVGPGILGLLGPNGAGKSTLMRIIATITRPTHGKVYWNGSDIAQQPDEIRAVLGARASNQLYRTQRNFSPNEKCPKLERYS